MQQHQHVDMTALPSPGMGQDEQALARPGEQHPSLPELPSELLLAELPDVTSPTFVPLAEIVDACVREIYKRLMELQEVLPSRHESARAREVFQFALWARRECVRLLAVVRWSREGEAVTKALNVIEFLQRQNAQFGQVIDDLAAVRNGLTGTRLRNPDILTALDVLTTGTYQRLPTCFQSDFKPVEPLRDEDVQSALAQLNRAISYRLRMVEVIPAEMALYRIADGRVYFHCPGFFKASFSLTGVQDEGLEDDAPTRPDTPQGGTWYLLSLEWDFHIGGREGLDDLRRDFPTTLPKAVFEEIAHYCKLQLTPPTPPLVEPLAGQPDDPPTEDPVALPHPTQQATPRTSSPYVKMRSPISVDGKVETGPGTGRAAGQGAFVEKAEELVIDAPLVRVYNLLESLGLTFHLEILHAQALRMQKLGWAQCFALELSRDRRSFKIAYWPRQRNQRAPGNNSAGPSTAGSLTVTLAPSSTSSSSSGGGILRRTLNDVENLLKSDLLGDDDRLPDEDDDLKPVVPDRPPPRVSDQVLAGELRAEWEVEKSWSGALDVAPSVVEQQPIVVDPLNLDMEAVLLAAVRTHANALIKACFKKVIDHPPVASAFDLGNGDIELVEEDPEVLIIRVRLHSKQVISVFVEPRTGRIVLRDYNEILNASGESRLAMSMRMINDNPAVINDILLRLKLSSTSEAAEQQLVYTAPKLTTPAARLRKAAMALHVPLLAKYDQLRANPSPDVQVLLWTKAIGVYCIVYLHRKSRFGLTIRMLPGTSTRRYLIEDASVSSSSALASSMDTATSDLADAPPVLLPAQAPSESGSCSRPRFLPISNLPELLRSAVQKIAARHPIAPAVVAQRKAANRAAPVVILDDRRAACELALGPEVLELLDNGILGAFAPATPLTTLSVDVVAHSQ